MSILVVEILPQGIIFGADRNITSEETDVRGGATYNIQGQTQRPKVISWPHRRALLGYVGAAEIGGIPTDEWLYNFIGDNIDFQDFTILSEKLRKQVEDQRRIDEDNRTAEPLIIHLGGFEKRSDSYVPVIWHIRNCYALNNLGYRDFRKEFQCSEAFHVHPDFINIAPRDIPMRLASLANEFAPFWFHQGMDLGTFNMLRLSNEAAVRALIHEKHPSFKTPQTLSDWEMHVRFLILYFSAYFQAFRGPSEQYVGGGVDIISMDWPA